MLEMSLEIPTSQALPLFPPVPPPGRDATDGATASKLPDTKAATGNHTDWDKVDLARWNEFGQTQDGRLVLSKVH